MRAALLALCVAPVFVSCTEAHDRTVPGPTTTVATARSLLARIEAVPAIGALVRTRGALARDATLLQPTELAVRLPLASDSAMRVARVGQDGVFVDVRAIDAAPVPGVIEDRSIAFAGTHADVDSLYFAAADRAEEIRMVRRASGHDEPLVMPYRVELGPALTDLRVIDGRAYAFDDRGVSLLRTDRAFAVDAKGMRRDLTIAVRREGEHAFTLTYSLDTQGLEAPIAVDPAWTSTASMAASRQHFSATAHTGSYPVIVAGGVDQTSAKLASGEVYLPSSNSWIPTSGSMATGRWIHKGVTLPSNKLFISGGYGPDGATLSTTEIYDPSFNSWSTGPTIPVAQVAHTMTVLASGNVLVSGDGAYVYNGSSWAAAGTPSTRRYQGGAVLLKNGKVLVTGGMDAMPFGTYLSSAELYNPATNSWALTGSLSVGRRWFGAPVLLPSGDVLVAGGQSSSGYASSVERYSVSAGTWTTIASMGTARAQHSITALSSGRLLVAGGTNSSSLAISGTELFDPTSSTWIAAGSMVVGRLNQATVALPGVDKVMIAGGSDYSNTLTSTEVFTPQTLGGTCVQPGECTSGFCTDGRCCEKATCGTGSSCAGSAAPGTCKKVNGQTCTTSGECANGQCIDGVCCASACAGQCQACDVPGSLGVCVPVPAGGAPRGARSACPGTGACRATCDGTTTTSRKSFHGASTNCSAARCSDPTHAVAAAGCDGAGSCVTALVTDCGKFACVASSSTATCNTTCTSTADCAPGYGCASGACQKGATGSSCTSATECASGFCVDGICCGASACPSSFKCNVPGKLGECSKPNGGKCSTGDECGSGKCVDGVCCNSACTGQCEACDVSGSEGTCSAVTGAPRGMRAACVGSGPCGGVCDGMVHDACTFPSAATSCGAASCAAGVETLAASCDGAGACTAATTHKCEPYNCGATSCKTACAADSDCATGKCDPASAKCVSGAQCDGDHTISNIDGTSNDCAPLKCAGSSCLAGCSTSTDCVAGFICDVASSRCIANTPADTGSDGGCTTSSEGRPPFTGLLVVAGAAVIAGIRRRRFNATTRR